MHAISSVYFTNPAEPAPHAHFSVSYPHAACNSILAARHVQHNSMCPFYISYISHMQYVSHTGHSYSQVSHLAARDTFT